MEEMNTLEKILKLLLTGLSTLYDRAESPLLPIFLLVPEFLERRQLRTSPYFPKTL
jgi:hypothetical protein